MDYYLLDVSHLPDAPATSDDHEMGPAYRPDAPTWVEFILRTKRPGNHGAGARKPARAARRTIELPIKKARKIFILVRSTH